MLQRVMPELMSMKGIVVLNDEAHHCYREKAGSHEEDELKGEDKDEAKKNNEAARLWISGIETVKRKLGLTRRLRPLGDALLPARLRLRRGHAVPLDGQRLLADGRDRVRHRQAAARAGRRQPADRRHAGLPQPLGAHRQATCPRRGAARAACSTRSSLPPKLQTALDALYGHYEKTFELWQEEGISVPPVFIVVCNNTATSKLVYDFISGFEREQEDGEGSTFVPRPPGAVPQLRRVRQPPAAPAHAADRQRAARIRRRARRRVPRSTPAPRSSSSSASWRSDPAPRRAEKITDQDLLREVMNTVGKPGRLGEQVRCVVSVSMLTEGWDTNTVTHILGVRAFGTQLLCEQVVGRGAAPPVLRAERGGPVRRRIRRHPGHPVRLHRQARGREAEPPERDRARPCRQGARGARDPLPAHRGLPGRAAERAHHGRVQRGLAAGADARAGRARARSCWRASSARA